MEDELPSQVKFVKQVSGDACEVEGQKIKCTISPGFEIYDETSDSPKKT